MYWFVVVEHRNRSVRNDAEHLLTREVQGGLQFILCLSSTWPDAIHTDWLLLAETGLVARDAAG